MPIRRRKGICANHSADPRCVGSATMVIVLGELPIQMSIILLRMSANCKVRHYLKFHLFSVGRKISGFPAVLEPLITLFLGLY